MDQTPQLDERETLVTVTAPHFCAGVILLRGHVVRAPPILKWSLGWEAGRLSSYFRSKGWRATQRPLPPASDFTLESEPPAAASDRPAFLRGFCNACGQETGGRSCNACLREWNGTWALGYWRRYFRPDAAPSPESPAP